MADGDPFERAFRAVFERSASPMALSDEDRRFREINPALIDRLGYTRDEMLGTRSSDYMRPEEQERNAEGYAEFRRKGEGISPIEMRTARGTFLRFLVHREANVLPGRTLAVMLLDPGPEEYDEAAVLDPETALTAREAEVLDHVAMGRTNAEIGALLFISPETVRTHVRNAMGRRGARNRAHLIAIALRDGAIQL